VFDWQGGNGLKPRAVKAADGTVLVTEHQGKHKYPAAFEIGGRKYNEVCGGDTFFFWDELIDDDNRTVGFTFEFPDNVVLQQSRLITSSVNVSLNGKDVWIDLSPHTKHKWLCVQGFGSGVYQCVDDPGDCVILLFNWSHSEAGFEVLEDAAQA
jgi:hypothetical protein